MKILETDYRLCENLTGYWKFKNNWSVNWKIRLRWHWCSKLKPYNSAVHTNYVIKNTCLRGVKWYSWLTGWLLEAGNNGMATECLQKALSNLLNILIIFNCRLTKFGVGGDHEFLYRAMDRFFVHIVFSDFVSFTKFQGVKQHFVSFEKWLKLQK